MDWAAIVLSLKLAALTTLLLLFLSAPIAYWLAFSRSRWKHAVQAVVALPLVLPPTVLGFYLLLALGPRSFVGRWFDSLFGGSLAFTFEGLLVASVIYSLPFAVQPLSTAFASINRSLLEASWCLGVSRLHTFFKLIIPLSTRSLLAAAVLTFAHTLGEFGVVLMVGGNIPGQTRTASIAIYESVQTLNYDRAAATSLVLLLTCFAALVLTYSLRRTVPVA